MNYKIVKDGQMAHDPLLDGEKDPLHKDKTNLIPESEDEFLTRKAKWKWKPSRLIFLFLGLQLLNILYLYSVIYLVNNKLLENNISYSQCLGVVIFLILGKKWWYNDSK